MIVAIPYVPVLTDYDNLAKELKIKGRMLNHVVTVIYRKEDEDGATIFADAVRELFARTYMHQLSVENRTDISLANDLFRAAVKFTGSYQWKEGEIENPVLLYFDPTYRPVEKNWADSLQAAYYLKRKRVFGKAVPCKGEGINETVFTGPVIIARHYAKESLLLPYLPPTEHWRVYLRHELCKDAEHTKLIGPGGAALLKIQRKKTDP